MKVCHYNNNQAGVVVGDQVINFGDALIKAGLARQGYTMVEIIDALANNPAAMQIARDAANGSGGGDLSSVNCSRRSKIPARFGPRRPTTARIAPRWSTAWAARTNRSSKRRFDGGAFHQDLFVDHRSRRHGDSAENVQVGRLRVRAVRRDRQEGAQSHRSAVPRTCLRLHDLWDISQRDPWGKGMHNTRNMRKGFDTFTALGPGS